MTLPADPDRQPRESRLTFSPDRETRPNLLRVSLRPRLDAAATARRMLDRFDQLQPTSLYDLKLLVTELVANSVRHAGLEPEQRIELLVFPTSDSVYAEVADRGPGFDLPSSLGRRGGLTLVSSIARDWGVARDGEISYVWFELER